MHDSSNAERREGRRQGREGEREMIAQKRAKLFSESLYNEAVL